jgi:hypothetical protein
LPVLPGLALLRYASAILRSFDFQDNRIFLPDQFRRN